MKIEIKKNCLCAHYMHEMLRYPREGLVSKEFKVGEQFDVIEDWSNFYGTYYRVKVDGKSHDIEKHNCKIVNY